MGGQLVSGPDGTRFASPIRFAGYAALFDREDRGGDIIRYGAFARAVRYWRAGGLPLLWQHRPAHCIGHIDSLAEDQRGLRVIGRLHEDAHEAVAALKERRISGLSFGYRVLRADGLGPRVLKDLDLMEVSLVTRPMQPGAQVHALA
ncbi:MAG: HK97 family phage prohead protease [Sphingobium sp.]|nr:HK97 family phage prohead protease [Sphingobium sp.]